MCATDGAAVLRHRPIADRACEAFWSYRDRSTGWGVPRDLATLSVDVAYHHGSDQVTLCVLLPGCGLEWSANRRCQAEQVSVEAAARDLAAWSIRMIAHQLISPAREGRS